MSVLGTEGTKLAVVDKNNGAFISLRPSKFWDMNESILGFPSDLAANDDLKRCLLGLFWSSEPPMLPRLRLV